MSVTVSAVNGIKMRPAAAAAAPHMAGDRHGDSLCRSNILRSCNAKKTAVKCLSMSWGREGYEKMHLAYDFEAV